MPRPAYTTKLSYREIRRLVAAGRYIVDLDEGTVVSGRTGKPLFTYRSERSPNLWVRVFSAPKHRALPLAHVIWTVGTGAGRATGVRRPPR